MFPRSYPKQLRSNKAFLAVAVSSMAAITAFVLMDSPTAARGSHRASGTSLAGGFSPPKQEREADVDNLVSGSYADPIAPVVRKNVRVVYQIKTDQEKKGIAAGLYYLDKLARAYDQLGIGRSDREIVGVFHGDAGYFLLNDPAYAKAIGSEEKNPNAAIVRKLIARGVRVELCKSTMQSHGWQGGDILPGIQVVVGAYPRIIDLQLRGYAYIRF